MSFFTELKRRNVFRVGAAYAILAWLLIQIIATVLPTFDAPRWIIQSVIFLIILGFPLALFLAWAFELTPEGLKAGSLPPADETTGQDFSRVKSQTLNGIIMGLVLLAVGFLLLDRFVIQNSAAINFSSAISNNQNDTIRTSIVLPDDQPLMFNATPNRSMAISPDGKTIAYVSGVPGLMSEGNFPFRLSVRSLSSLETRQLPGTDAAAQPFFSPDGQWVGFFTVDGALKKVPLTGGRPITLLEEISGAVWSFASWMDNDQIILAINDDNEVLTSISAEGGEFSMLTSLDETAGEISHRYPFTIPGTQTVLFEVRRRVENQILSSIEALDVSTAERTKILDGASYPHYVDSGYLLFQRDGVNLLAPFDPVQLDFTGSAIPIIDEIRKGGPSGNGELDQFVISRNGSFAYLPAVNTLLELYLVDQEGNAEPLALRPDRYILSSVSPDGRYAALEITDTGGGGSMSSASGGVRIYDFIRQTTTRLSSAQRDHSPFWYPDSSAVSVSSFNEGRNALWLKWLDGRERLLYDFTDQGFGLRNGSWHPNGKQMAITYQEIGTDIHLLSMAGDEGSDITLEPMISESRRQESPRISPDGKWLAYISQKSGRLQVYVRRFEGGDEVIVSTGVEAVEPIWSKNQSTLYFIQEEGLTLDDRAMYSVAISEINNRIEAGQPQRLFPVRHVNELGTFEYMVGANAGPRIDVLPDGRFIMARARANSSQTQIVLVQHWLGELQAMMSEE